ncbi:MAG: MarR family transcriptional regulator [Chitinophagaceae bacterium]|nr:MAG: MarR family transcriptional regulator [Chitinophagaceae bacterium]
MDVKKEVVNIRKLSQRYAYTSIQLHESIGRKTGLLGTDHKYLGFLIQKGQMTAGELAVLTGLTTGAVTGLIDRFESKNLAKRKPDKIDRRKIIIVPNVEKITKLITPFYEDFQNNTDELFSSFTFKELSILEKYFHKALEIMDREIEKINEK